MLSRDVAESMWRIYRKRPKQNLAFKKKSERMRACGSWLEFDETVNEETGEVSRKLRRTQFCKDRLCPMCSWRKSLVTFYQVSKIMNEIEKTHSDLFPIFLTLTVKNCRDDELGDEITHILRAWTRMMNVTSASQPSRVVRGWMRTLEVTYNEKKKTWHPHIHAILLVDADYFKNKEKYLSQRDWQYEWQQKLKIDYNPRVDVRTIKGERFHAVAEVSKYAVKPGEWLNPDDKEGTDKRIEILAKQLKGRRLVAFGGLMGEVRRALAQEDAETADLVHVGEDQTMRGDLLVAIERYKWQIGVSNYVLWDSEPLRAIPGARGLPR